MKVIFYKVEGGGVESDILKCKEINISFFTKQKGCK